MPHDRRVALALVGVALAAIGVWVAVSSGGDDSQVARDAPRAAPSGGPAQAPMTMATVVFEIELGRGSPNGLTFEGPFGVHVDPRGRLIVVDDLAHAAFVFGDDGRLIERFGTEGAGPGQFLYPDGVTTDATGNVFIADAGANRVQVFGPAWAPLAEIRRWGLIGRLNNPRDVAVGHDGRIFVADWGNHCVRVFDASYRHLHTIGGRGDAPGRFVNPASVAIDADGRLLVSDHGNHRLQVFDSTGELQRVIGSPGAGPGQFATPLGVAVDASGQVYVADSGNRRVQMITPNGEAMNAITGGPDAPLEQPVDVAVSTGRVYVSDAGRHSVQVYRKSGPRPPLR